LVAFEAQAITFAPNALPISTAASPDATGGAKDEPATGRQRARRDRPSA